MRYYKLSLFIVLTFMLFALTEATQAQSLFGPKFRAYIYSAPEKYLPGVRKIAILNFENRSSYSVKLSGNDIGRRMNNYLTEQLEMEFRGIRDKNKLHMKGARTNIYKITEKSRLDQVLKEQRLSVRGTLEESQVANVGRRLGVDAVIIGSIAYTHKDVKQHKQKQDSRTKKYYNIYTYTRTLTTDVVMKIISVKTTRIIGTTTFRISSRDYKEFKKNISLKAVASVDHLADQCARKLAPLLASYFCPTFVYNTFDIEKIKVKKFRKKAREAREYLKRGMVAKAFPLYKSIYDADSNNPKVAYNLGAIYEVNGDFKKAYELYTIAHEKEPDDKWYSKCYQRAKKGMDMVNDLRSTGIKITRKLTGVSTGSQNATVKSVITKCSSNERVKVYQEKNTHSKVIAKVPRGISLKVLNKTEGWFYVYLRGGKRGYISNRDVSNN